MTRSNTLRPRDYPELWPAPEKAGYTKTITKVRVYRIRPDESADAQYGQPGTILDEEGYVQTPWWVDGFNENTGAMTQEATHHRTHAEALADAATIVEDWGLTLEPVRPRLDPYPFHCFEGPSCRHSQKLAPSTRFAPRPEYSQNREDYAA